MINILEKYLNKIGVKSYAELTSEEKETYKVWEESISGRKLTDDEVKTFLEQELDIAINKMTETNLSQEDMIFRKMEVKFIRKVLGFLDGPRREKELVEKQIASQL